jgi:hypothetical protein
MICLKCYREMDVDSDDGNIFCSCKCGAYVEMHSPLIRVNLADQDLIATANDQELIIRTVPGLKIIYSIPLTIPLEEVSNNTLMSSFVEQWVELRIFQ